MNVLITTHTYLPNSDGVQFVNEYLAEGLIKKGYKVDVITYKTAKSNLEEECINGVNIYRIDARTRYTFHIGEKVKYQEWLLRNYEKYDVMINVCTQTALTDWVLPIIDKIKIPKILYLHSIWDFKIYCFDCKSVESLLKKIFANIRWFIYYRKWNKAFKKYNRVIQLHQKDYAWRLFKKWYQISSDVIENAADDSFFDNSIDNSVIVPEKYILNVSNYMDRKNQLSILKSFLALKEFDEYELILIGSTSNEYFNKLKRVYSKYLKNGGKKRVQLLYGINREKIYTYVKKASLYVMASKWEAFPISIIEAMAAGVPYISTNVGIVNELVGGIVISNSNELGAAIENLLQDNKRRKELGIIGREYAMKNLMIQSKVDALEHMILESVNG